MKNPIFTKDVDGAYRIMTPEEVTAASKAHLARRVRKGTTMNSPQLVRDYFISQLSEEPNEIFAVLYLDNRHRVIQFDRAFSGTIDGTSVYPRVIVKRALELNAAACIFSHQHPSGTPEPSQADERITRRLKAALELVDIRVLDHIIVGGGESVSLAERGLL